MKKIFFIVMFALFAIMTQAQQLAPKGIKIGKDPTAVLITDAISNGTNVIFKSGAVVLSPADPDTVDFETYAVLKADTATKATGNYMTWQNSYYDYTSEYLFRLINMAGVVGAIKAVPIMSYPNGNTIALGDGALKGMLFYLPEKTTITGAKWLQVQQGAYTSDNYNGVILYKINGANSDSVAYSANDGDIWKAANNAIGSKAFTDPYVADAGWYRIALIYNQSAETTPPILLYTTVNTYGTSLLGYVIAGLKSGITAPPATLSNAELTPSGVSIFLMPY